MVMMFLTFCRHRFRARLPCRNYGKINSKFENDDLAFLFENQKTGNKNVYFICCVHCFCWNNFALRMEVDYNGFPSSDKTHKHLTLKETGIFSETKAGKNGKLVNEVQTELTSFKAHFDKQTSLLESE
jgi:hypothetical protein